MLSKSQARLFFLGATLGFSGVFVALTVDTIRQLPARTHLDKMDESVVRGKEIWESNNCMGCHTLLGEGAYYAPELTKVVERRGKPWIKVFLKDPEAMFPGRRKMVNYHFSNQEMDDVIAFFDWIGHIDTNGFPAKPDLSPASTSPPRESANAGGADAPPIFRSVCTACHAIDGSGGTIGPNLNGVNSRYSRKELRAWLADPKSVKPDTAMPNLGLSDADLDALTNFLMTK